MAGYEFNGPLNSISLSPQMKCSNVSHLAERTALCLWPKPVVAHATG